MNVFFRIELIDCRHIEHGNVSQHFVDFTLVSWKTKVTFEAEVWSNRETFWIALQRHSLSLKGGLTYIFFV